MFRNGFKGAARRGNDLSPSTIDGLMPIQAYVLIRAKPGMARNVADAIAKIAGCKSVCTVTGRYDVIALLEAEDLKSLGDLILQKVHTVDGVERTETAVVV